MNNNIYLFFFKINFFSLYFACIRDLFEFMFLFASKDWDMTGHKFIDMIAISLNFLSVNALEKERGLSFFTILVKKKNKQANKQKINKKFCDKNIKKPKIMKKENSLVIV